MFPSFFQVKLSLRDDPVLLSGSINPHNHPRQHHPPPPSSSRSYDSPSSSSPASSNNDPPPPICRSATSCGPPPPPTPPAHHLNSFGKPRPLGALQPLTLPKPSGCGGTAETAVHSPVTLPGASVPGAAGDGSVDDPSMRSFQGKIKAFEKMDHFARAQRMLELQEAQSARVGKVQRSRWDSVYGIYLLYIFPSVFSII